MNRFEQVIQRHFGSVRTFILVFAVAAIAAGFLISQKPQPCDDAYITFRHVKNFVERGRPAWNNDGPPILGSTSPAYMFTLATVCWIFQIEAVEWAALCVNTFLHFWIVLLAFLCVKDVLGRSAPALLAACLIGFNSINIYIFSQGFENAMLCAGLLAGMYLVRRGHFCFAVLTSSMLPLVRPEGILGVAVVVGYLLMYGRTRLRSLAAIFPIPLLWLVWSAVYYGSPIPQPLHAIKQFPKIYEPYEGTEVQLVQRIASAPSGTWELCKRDSIPLLVRGGTSTESDTPFSTVRVLFVIVGFLLCLVLFLRACVQTSVYFLYPVLFLFLFGWLGHTRIWYFPSFVTFSLMLLICGWSAGIETMFARLTNLTANDGRRRWPILAFECLLFLIFVASNRFEINRGDLGFNSKGPIFAQHPAGFEWDLFERQRFHHYRHAAELLNERSPQSRALVSEVGVFGYYYRGEVIDAVGLCSPEVLQYYPPSVEDIHRPDGLSYSKSNNVVPLRMVEGLRPDYVLNSLYYIANLFREGSSFSINYREVARFGLVWRQPVVIYERRDASRMQ